MSAGIPDPTPNPLPPLPMSPESMPNRLQSVGRFGLRGLRIAASTFSILALLRSDWNGGIGAGLAGLSAGGAAAAASGPETKRLIPRSAAESAPGS